MVERLEDRGGSPIPPKSCRIEGEIRKVFGTEVRRLPIVCAGLDHTEIVDSATKKDNRIAQCTRSQVLAIDLISFAKLPILPLSRLLDEPVFLRVDEQAS
jgi:hypothetical protein